MELSEHIKQIRENSGLTQKAFAEKIGVSAMLISIMEKPFAESKKLPSENVLRRIAQEYSSNELERKEMERKLLLERAKFIVAPEIVELLEGNEKMLYEGMGMPKAFIDRIKADIKSIEKNIRKNPEEFANKTKISVELMDNVLKGKEILTREQVILLSKYLLQEPDEYILLANYIPDAIKDLIHENGVLGMFRSLNNISKDNLPSLIKVISQVIMLQLKKREQNGE